MNYDQSRKNTGEHTIHHDQESELSPSAMAPYYSPITYPQCLNHSLALSAVMTPHAS